MSTKLTPHHTTPQQYLHNKQHFHSLRGVVVALQHLLLPQRHGAGRSARPAAAAVALQLLQVVDHLGLGLVGDKDVDMLQSIIGRCTGNEVQIQSFENY